jgi:hypothetical protein
LLTAFLRNRIVDIYLKNVHGQFSRPSLKFNWSILRRLCQKPTIDNNKLVLVEVPDSLTVEPPIGSASELSELVQVNGSVTIEPPTESISETPEPLALELACNYSLFKVFAAICQTVYGAIELFNSRGRQLDTYGYAAYALTVVPYILMSLVNLLATICQPQYPSMFIVTYEGKLKPGNRMMDELPFAGENSSSREQTELAVPEVKSKIGGTVGIAYGLVQVGSKPRVVDRIWENLRVFWKLSLKVSSFSSSLHLIKSTLTHLRKNCCYLQ